MDEEAVKANPSLCYILLEDHWLISAGGCAVSDTVAVASGSHLCRIVWGRIASVKAPASVFSDDLDEDGEVESGEDKRPALHGKPRPGQSPSPQSLLEFRRSTRRGQARMPSVKESDAEAPRISFDEASLLQRPADSEQRDSIPEYVLGKCAAHKLWARCFPYPSQIQEQAGSASLSQQLACQIKYAAILLPQKLVNLDLYQCHHMKMEPWRS